MILSFIYLGTGILLVISAFVMLATGVSLQTTIIALILPAVAFIAVANLGGIVATAIKSQAERIEVLERLLAERFNSSFRRPEQPDHVSGRGD